MPTANTNNNIDVTSLPSDVVFINKVLTGFNLMFAAVGLSAVFNPGVPKNGKILAGLTSTYYFALIAGFRPVESTRNAFGNFAGEVASYTFTLFKSVGIGASVLNSNIYRAINQSPDLGDFIFISLLGGGLDSEFKTK